MDRKDYTPTKGSKLYGSNSYNISSGGRESYRFSGQAALIREYQALKLAARQLQIQNRQLNSEVEKLRYQRNLHESKLLQKATFEEQAMNQYQKEKSYQLEMVKIKNEQSLNRVRRQYELRVDDMAREVKTRDLMNRDLADKHSYLQGKSQEFRKNLQNLQMQLLNYRDNNSSLTEQLTREQFANKKLQMLAEELQRQKNQMQTQIHILLDIETEKSQTINALEIELENSQNSEQMLHQKLGMLTDNFSSLEEHIAVMKESLTNSEQQGEDIEKQLQRTQAQIHDKQQLILEQRQRKGQLIDEIQSHKERQSRRLNEINQMIAQNEKIYHDLTLIKHKLYEVSIEQDIDI